MEKHIRLVVGLGNPGSQYNHTWHNLGFLVLRHLADQLKIGLKHQKKLLSGRGSFAGVDIVLALPQSFMNLSGIPVSRLVRKLSLQDDQILVVHDDHDLPRGVLRLRSSGGDGGHLGMRSILQEIGGHTIPRLRIGIREEIANPEVGGYDDLADRVLTLLTPCEEKHVDRIVEAAGEVVLDWLQFGILTAMNRHNNRRITSPRSE